MTFTLSLFNGPSIFTIKILISKFKSNLIQQSKDLLNSRAVL